MSRSAPAHVARSLFIDPIDPVLICDALWTKARPSAILYLSQGDRGMSTFGTAGGHARSVVRRRAQRASLMLLVLTVLFAVIFQVLLGRAWLALPLVVVALLKDRAEVVGLFMPWIKGARGEEAVGRFLAELVPEGYRILHDVDTGRGNLDHVAVGPTGVWAIETKAWTGTVYAGKGGVFMRNGRDEKATLKQAMGEAFEVKSRIAHTGLTPWVNALVVLTATRLPKGPMKFGQVRVIESKDLLSTIRSGPTRMSPEDIKVAARAVMLGAGVRTYKVTSWDGEPAPDT